MNRRTLHAALAALFLGTPVYGSTQRPAPPQSGVVALVGGTVHTVSGEDQVGGTVVFEDGRITALGPGVEVPRDALVVDVSGKHVYPALINAFTSVGLTEVGSVRGTVDQSESGRINPNVRAEVSVNPESEIIPVTRANGIALALAAPSGGTLSGRSALLRMDGWTWEDLTYKAPVALHVDWPAMAISTSPYVRRSEEEQKQERDQALAALDLAFRDARAYGTARSDPGSGLPTDLRWEAMQPALKGELPVMVLANSLQEIQAAVGWAATWNLKLILVGGADAWRVTRLLAEHEVPVIIAGAHRMPARRGDPYDAPFALAAKLYEAGVKFCISSTASWSGEGDASNARNLPYEAAKAAAYGLPKSEALRSVTLYPAQILGVADRVGSLAVGMDATIMITDGDPLEISTQVEQLYIEGRRIDLSSRHTELYEKYRSKYSGR